MPSGSITMIAGVVYAYLAFAVLALLWYSRRFTRRRALVFLAASALLGFLVFAPVFPFMVQEVVLGNLPVLIGLVVFIVLVFLAGRIICGQVCAVGAVQELVYLIPVKKHRRTANLRQAAIRAAVFIVILVAGAGFSVNLLALLGLRAFFNLRVASVPFVIFLAILLVSVFFYRPFCRYICPYGALLAPVSSRAVYRLRRTDACINCRKCERACPTGAADPDARFGECYLCGRCTEACPVEGALVYARKGGKE
jgi:ferredoxin-type protein NapH